MVALHPLEVADQQNAPKSFQQNSPRRPVLASPTRKSVLATIFAPDSPVKGAFCPHIDGICQDRLNATRSLRTSIWDQATEEQLAVDNPEFYESLNKGGHAIYFFQAVAIVGTVLSYAAPPILVSWARTIDYNTKGIPVKVETFFPASIVLLAKVATVVISLGFALYWDWKEGGGSHRYLKWMTNWRDIGPWFTIGGVYALADIAEIIALGSVDPATYMILSQLHLVGTAVVARFLLGSTLTPFQWSILANLTLVIIGWLLIPDIDVSEKDKRFGCILCFAKMLVSSLVGAMMQRFRHLDEVPLLVQSAHTSIAGLAYCTIITPALIFFFYPVLGAPWLDQSGQAIGFFGGRMALDANGEAIVTGWSSGKTYAVLGMYIFRDIFCTYGIQRLNASVKNICNAIALVVTYALAMWLLGELPFNQVKGLLTIVICIEILHYGFAETREMK